MYMLLSWAPPTKLISAPPPPPNPNTQFAAADQMLSGWGLQRHYVLDDDKLNK